MNDFFGRLARAEAFRRAEKRPLIVVSYAQSLNGCVALEGRKQVHLSGQESLRMTHHLRSACHAIVVGIGTVLADDPRLTVRFVDGPNPQPIVLDTHLRLPLEAHLLQRKDLSPWIIAGPECQQVRAECLQQAGATVLRCAVDSSGQLDLWALMRLLNALEIKSLMIEGGAQVISSFLNAKLVDYLVVTIAPKFLRGVPVLDPSRFTIAPQVTLTDVAYQTAGEDVILWGTPAWETR